MYKNNKRAKVIDYLSENCSADTVINLLMQFVSEENWEQLHDQLEKDGIPYFCESEDGSGNTGGAKLSFQEVCDEIQYLCVDDTNDKSANEVADEIRERIRSFGWDCTEEYDSPEDWLDEHPEHDADECEESAVCDLEFLCNNEYARTGHDVDWYTFSVSFFGKWGEYGTFVVSH